MQLVIGIGPNLFLVDLLDNAFGLFRVVPEIWVVGLLLFVYYLSLLMIDVKGTPSALPGARSSLGCRLVLS